MRALLVAVIRSLSAAQTEQLIAPLLSRAAAAIYRSDSGAYRALKTNECRHCEWLLFTGTHSTRAEPHVPLELLFALSERKIHFAFQPASLTGNSGYWIVPLHILGRFFVVETPGTLPGVSFCNKILSSFHGVSVLGCKVNLVVQKAVQKLHEATRKVESLHVEIRSLLRQLQLQFLITVHSRLVSS